jgi:type VI secretion system protein ImpK
MAPPPRPVEPDTDPFATQVSFRQSPPKAAAAPAAASGHNPLLSEADALLALVPQLRSTPQVADVPQLRSRIVGLLQQFDEGLRKRGVALGQAQKAHFVLCALLDEVAETMPWGANNRWERLNPLKAAAPRAGDSTMRQLAQMAEGAGANRDLCELVYAALALGFDARGRGTTTGTVEADQVRARLASLLERGDGGAQPLAVRWRPAVGRASAMATWLPLWVGSFVVAGLLAALYFALALALASRSDSVYAQIAALRLPAAAAPRAAPAPQPRLAPLLGTPASGGALQVRDEIDRSVVTLSDSLLFEPADASLLRTGADLLRPVAAALQRTAGQVVVVGHTDSRAARSARFPSNWELSVERARAVQDALLLFGIAPNRLRYDGRADTEPLPAGAAGAAAHNGRIEIVLLAGR